MNFSRNVAIFAFRKLDGARCSIGSAVSTEGQITENNDLKPRDV